MSYKPYTLHINEDNTRYEFQSLGKRGIFEKVIIISLLDNPCNLALLDYDPVTDEYTDLSITDNGDMKEILATVMHAIKLFLTVRPSKLIQFTGSSQSRTRLYQIAINKVHLDLKKDFEIYGWLNEEWVPFEPNLSFESFLIGKSIIT